jgi:hypothetical protein
VVLNFSVVSQGRQFDRLAIMYLGDTEVCKSYCGARFRSLRYSYFSKGEPLSNISHFPETG